MGSTDNKMNNDTELKQQSAPPSQSDETLEWLKKVYSLGQSDNSVVPQRNAGEMLARLDELGFGAQEGRRGNTLWAMVMDAADEIEKLRGSKPSQQEREQARETEVIIDDLLNSFARFHSQMERCAGGVFMECMQFPCQNARRVVDRIAAALASKPDTKSALRGNSRDDRVDGSLQHSLDSESVRCAAEKIVNEPMPYNWRFASFDLYKWKVERFAEIITTELSDAEKGVAG